MTIATQDLTRILFVDDDPNVISGLRRQLRGMRDRWDMMFAGSGAEALEIVCARELDVVVSDMRMPGMDGAALLEEVRRRQPKTVRIVLSGQSDMELIYRVIGPCHQYLSKPCDTDTIVKMVVRASRLRRLLDDDRLIELASAAEVMPARPRLFQRIVDELSSSNSSLRRVGEIIAEDMGMTAKMLQLVNSAFFGLGREVSHPAEAVTYLGVETVRTLVLSMEVFQQFGTSSVLGLTLDDLWRHGLEVAQLSRRIAIDLGLDHRSVDQSFTAGMMHDIGLVCLVAGPPQALAHAFLDPESDGRSDAERVKSALKSSHAELGAYMLGIWGLPDPIIEAVAYHGHPGRCANADLAPLTAVHLADCLLPGRIGESFASSWDEPYLAALGLTEQAAVWRALASEGMLQ